MTFLFVASQLRREDVRVATVQTRHLRTSSQASSPRPVTRTAVALASYFPAWVSVGILPSQEFPFSYRGLPPHKFTPMLGVPWEQDLIGTLPRFPKPREQRDVAGRHYLTKAEINALYFATHQMDRPRGWNHQIPVGRYWRCALVVFFNYGVDTGTVWKSTPLHEPILWRHISWERHSPDREVNEQSPWGWRLSQMDVWHPVQF